MKTFVLRTFLTRAHQSQHYCGQKVMDWEHSEEKAYPSVPSDDDLALPYQG